MTLVQGKIAVIEGLDNDSESGTELQFSSGPSGYVTSGLSFYKNMHPGLILGMFSIGYCYGEGTIMSSLGLSQRAPTWYLLGTR